MAVYRVLYRTVFILLILNGCGYNFVGMNTSKSDYGRPVWVAFIGNATSSSTAQTILKRVMLDELHAFRGLIPAAVSSESELLITGNLKSYSTRAVSYTSADQIRELRLTIEVELEVRSNKSRSVIWKGVLKASQDFPASDPRNLDLAQQKNAEEAALSAASRKLAHSLITSMEDSY